MPARLIIDLSISEDDFSNRIFITDIGTDNKEKKRLEKRERERENLFMVSTIRLTSLRL